MNSLAHQVAEDIMAVSQEAESGTKARLGYRLQSLIRSDSSITTKPHLLKGFTTSKTAAPAGDQQLKCKSLGAHGHSHQNILAGITLDAGEMAQWVRTPAVQT